MILKKLSALIFLIFSLNMFCAAQAEKQDYLKNPYAIAACVATGITVLSGYVFWKSWKAAEKSNAIAEKYNKDVCDLKALNNEGTITQEKVKAGKEIIQYCNGYPEAALPFEIAVGGYNMRSQPKRKDQARRAISYSLDQELFKKFNIYYNSKKGLTLIPHSEHTMHCAALSVIAGLIGAGFSLYKISK